VCTLAQCELDHFLFKREMGYSMVTQGDYSDFMFLEAGGYQVGASLSVSKQDELV